VSVTKSFTVLFWFGGSMFDVSKFSFDMIDERAVTGLALADVIGVTAELPFAEVLLSALFVASFTSWNFSIN
jgi:hypothetical protein